jgi:hypothetical protein
LIFQSNLDLNKEIKVNKSFIKKPDRFRELLAKHRLETGFSMLEAVVVVGVLLALAVGGFFAYGPITENAKIAKVKSAASEVHTGVLVASMDGDSNTQPQGVIDDWNDSTGKIRVEILEPTAGGPSANGDFCVQATNVESPTIAAKAGACDDVTGGGSGVSDPNDLDGDGIPNASDPDIDEDGIPNGEDTTPNGETGGTGGGNGATLTADTWSGQRTITNIYPDPGFKKGISGWTGNNIYSAYVDNAATTVSYAGAGYKGDAGALTISATGSAGRDRTTAYFPMDINAIKNFSFQITTPDGTWDPNASWYAGVIYTDSSTGAVIDSNSGQAKRAGGAGANVWERYDATNMWAAPTQPHNTYLYIQADHVPVGRTISIIVDRIFAVGADCDYFCAAPDSPSVPGYEPNFDGSYPSSADWTYSWTGAVDASPSKAVAPRNIGAPTTATVGDTIQIKGTGYAANSTVTPVLFYGGAPGWDPKDITLAPVQTDSSGNFDTAALIPADTQPWNWGIAVKEDTSYTRMVRININSKPGTGPSTATPPGPWSDPEDGTTEVISAPAVISFDSDFIVMGKGYAPFTRVDLYDESWNVEATAYTDNTGYFTVTMNIPTGNDAVGPGYIQAYGDDYAVLNVTFQ